VGALLTVAAKELELVRKICDTPPSEEIFEITGRGSTQTDFVDHRFGLDIGVETLCLALNLWRGVYTVNSCSGLHAGANIKSPHNGHYVNNEQFVSFVSDRHEALIEIQRLAETGAVGIKFAVEKSNSLMDNATATNEKQPGEFRGFAQIEGADGTSCRTYCRRIAMPDDFIDKVDHAVSYFAPFFRMPIPRSQMFIVGCLGLALKLVKENPKLSLTAEEVQKMNWILRELKELRRESIEKCTMFKEHSEQECFGIFDSP
jgi:hypothetical protein